jgi:hypothetical protein
MIKIMENYVFEQLTEEENKKVKILQNANNIKKIKNNIKNLSLLEKLALLIEMDNNGWAIVLNWFSKHITRKL